MLVIVHGRARQRRHGLALCAADQHADLFRRMIFHVAGMDQQPRGDFDVPKVFGNLGRIIHRAPDEGDLSAMLKREVHGQLDAMDGRGKAGDKQSLLSPRENFVELATHRSFARGVAFALNVGRILQKG